MSAPTLPTAAGPCWVLTHRDTDHDHEEGDGIPHFSSAEEASERLATLRERVGTYYPHDQAVVLANLADLEPRQEDHCCVLGPICAECDCTFDEWCDGWNHLDPESAVRDIEGCDWRHCGDDWFCGDCAPTEVSP